MWLPWNLLPSTSVYQIKNYSKELRVRLNSGVLPHIQEVLGSNLAPHDTQKTANNMRWGSPGKAVLLQTQFTNSLITKDPECQGSTCLRRFKLLFIPILPCLMWLLKLATVFCHFALLGINNISDEIICISRDIETSGEDERNTSMSGNDSFFFSLSF